MINRYSRKEIVNIWSEENKYKIWLDIEIAAAQAMEKYKIIPKGVVSTVRKKAKINVKRIHQIEKKVKHDVIAFLTSITERSGIKSRYLHQGMTSSDVILPPGPVPVLGWRAIPFSLATRVAFGDASIRPLLAAGTELFIA